jgi:hypothetical protein
MCAPARCALRSSGRCGTPASAVDAHQHTHTHIYSSSGRYLRPLAHWPPATSGQFTALAFARSLRRLPTAAVASTAHSRVRVAAGTSRFELRAGELRNFRGRNRNFRKLPERNRKLPDSSARSESAPSEPGAAGVAAVAGVGRWNARCATWRARTCSRSGATRLSGRCALFGGEAHAHACAAHGPYTYMHTHTHTHTCRMLATPAQRFILVCDEPPMSVAELVRFWLSGNGPKRDWA